MTDRAGRVAAPAALALFVVVGMVISQRPVALVVPVGVAVTALGGVLAWRGPTGLRLATGLAAAAAGVVVLADGQPQNVGWFGICVLAGWMALRSSAAGSAAFGAGLVGVFVVQWLGQTEEPSWGAWVAGTVFTTTACIFARSQRVLADRLREAQAGLAERTRAEERNRIAGEMHDVIGHALTVALLHVSSARLALEDDRHEASASLAEAERLARTSLAEVRAAVGLMRGQHPSTVSPMPGARDVTELVESFRRAGASVDLAVTGDLSTLGTTRGLAVYRIVQESLTNVARHAAGESASVRIETDEGGATVTVANGGTSPPVAEEGSGLIGMRARTDALGGRLQAGPSQEGWRVEAVLPP